MLRLLLLSAFVVAVSPLQAADWLRFRGPNGSGIAATDRLPPAEWGSEKNIKWAIDLPGPGHSSPIVVGDKIFLTCWTGYGLDRRDPGDQENLKRHLVCLDRGTGSIAWTSAVAAKLPEDTYGGMFAEHGYATHTPVSDGERVYCFFGKSGVHAFDLEGKTLWSVDTGDGLDPRSWGSASSLILSGDLVIVTAGAESGCLFGLNKRSGETVWKQEVSLTGMWGTPILTPVDETRTDLVVAVPEEIWGLNPETGKLRWYCDGIQDGSMNSSPIFADSVIYAIDGRNGDAVAVRAGGKGDVNDSHVVWHESHRGRISSPVFYQGRLYWVAGGVVNCIEAKSGERIYQERLEAPASTSNRGGGRSARGGQDYSSPVVAGNRMYFFNRQGVGFVVELRESFKQLAANTLEDAEGDFSATPAIVDGEMYLRGTTKLYCIAATNEAE